MKQILCLSYTPWRTRPSRTQQLLVRLANAKILFFEPAPPKGVPLPKQGRRVRSHIMVYTLPTSLPGPKEQSLFGRRRLDKATDFIQQVMNKHHFREPVLWCTAPIHAQFLDKLAYRGAVYDCHRFWDESFLELESDLTCHAEVVFAASTGLIKRLSPCNDNIALLPNGVNPLLFSLQEHSIPPALANLPGRAILGRVGSVTGRIDLAPLLYAARHRPEWTFVLMGPATKQAVQKLAGQDNIMLTGAVNPLDLPDYLCQFDVLFDLLRQDRLGSDVVSPVIYEYFAAGKPVAAVSDPSIPDPFPRLIHSSY
ncbi:MAG: hypothetical protein K2K53_08505, partial [Oscillospiraceae bacterium]|nr:hypothetical protein [Oscillospiraceae bacterium]